VLLDDSVKSCIDASGRQAGYPWPRRQLTAAGASALIRDRLLRRRCAAKKCPRAPPPARRRRQFDDRVISWAEGVVLAPEEAGTRTALERTLAARIKAHAKAARARGCRRPFHRSPCEREAAQHRGAAGTGPSHHRCARIVLLAAP
jgi:hypothetical protein